MNWIALIGFIIISFASVYGQEVNNCNKFHTGVFSYPDVSNSKVIIKRTRKNQIEIARSTKTKVILTVNWVTDCEAQLTYKKIIGDPKAAKNLIGKIMIVRITEVDGDIYKFSATLPSGKVIEGRHKKEK